MARFTRLALYISMTLLMLSAALEMALISSTVYWLHYRAGKDFRIFYNDGTFSLHGKPAGLLTDQGHTSNGAAGTAFVAIGLGGILAFWLRSRSQRTSNQRAHGFARFMYMFWFIMTFLSALLSLAALVYTDVLTYQHNDQSIDLTVASKLNNRPNPNYVAYPTGFWTPENWLAALLELPLARESDRNDIATHLATQKAWRWNLIPITVLGLVVCALACIEHVRMRREERGLGRKRMST